MDTPDDNTAVIRMKRDFDAFISSQSGSASGRINFDQTASLDISRGSAVSMQSVLEKQKEDQKLRADLIAAKGYITKLELQLAAVEASNKRARVEYDRDLGQVKLERMRESEQITELKNQLHFIAEREKRLQEELEECKQTLSKTKTSQDQKLLGLQKEKYKLENELEEVQEASRSKVTELNNHIMRQQTELKIKQNELDETKEKFRMYKERSRGASNILENAEKLKADQKIKELELKLQRMEEDGITTKAMKSQLTQLPELEKEARKLREENRFYRETSENTHLLKEQLESLKQKCERMEERGQELAKLKVENEDLKNKLKQWESPGAPGGWKVQSPSQLSHRIADLQNSQLTMLEQEGKLKSSIHSMQASLENAQSKLNQVSRELVVEQNKSTQQGELLKRLQRKLLLVSKERDGYKKIIESYESEVTVNVGSQSTTRVQQLEATVLGYQKQCEALEAQANQAQQQLGDCRIQCQQLEHKLRVAEQTKSLGSGISEVEQKTILQLREKIAGLEKQSEMVSEEKEILEARIEQRNLQGDYDPTKTKVLHFSMNPAAMAQKQRQEELAQLREENRKLKERVKLLETSGGVVEDITQKVDQNVQQPSTSKEVVDIKAQLSTAELKNKRLMEAFKKTSQEFREVCYQLTGYKIDIPCTNQYRLMSMYAESPDDFLVFQQTSTGEMQLLATDFSATMSHFIETYLQKNDSIPAFLSSVTLDLFSRQTLML